MNKELGLGNGERTRLRGGRRKVKGKVSMTSLFACLGPYHWEVKFNTCPLKGIEARLRSNALWRSVEMRRRESAVV